ncbi:unnamed protein product [Ophioblennius macclurei]
MSFSRAPLKRFNENIGCAPPPGSYDIKSGDLKGAASFDKSDRFKPPKEATTAMQPPPSPSRNAPQTPVRRAISVDGLADGSSARKDKTGMTVDRKQQKLLEKEIRSLVQQRGEQDRRLQALGEELKKAEAKLLASVREKTGLAANVTTLERQRVELKKVNDFLKNKVSADATKKRINSLTMELMEAKNNLDVKSKELSVLQVNSEGKLKELDSDLQAARNSVASLTERNTNLEDLHQGSKTQNTELENENARLRAVICELKEELKVLQGYLDEANEQIQDLRLQIQGKTEEETAAGSHEKLKDLQAELEQRTTELKSTQDALRQKEDELESSQKALKITEDEMSVANQKIHESETTIHQQEVELLRLRDVLRRTEEELDERVAHLEQRCIFSEEERSKTQEEGLRRVDQLKNELNSVSEDRSEALRKQIQLKQENEKLGQDLAKQKEVADSLSVLVQFEREESEKRVKQLKDEIEEILGELALMEEQERTKQEAFLRLQGQKEDLERQLSDTGALLDSERTDVSALRNEHFAAIRELREAHTVSLGEMGDIVTELESTKEALKAAKGRESELETEVERVSRQMKDKMDEMVEQKEEEIRRAREVFQKDQESQLAEEKARMLLEVQTLLAQRDEEMKATEASHAIQINQLQQELQLQTKGKEEALGRLREQMGQSVSQIQSEWEKAQKLLQEVSREKEEIMEQFQQERHEKAKIREEKEALEVERTEQRQVRSEVIRLQAELERAGEEKTTLLSEAEEKDKATCALENLLSTSEHDRNQLLSRLREVEQEGVCLQAQANFTEEKAQALREQVEVLTQEKVTLQWEMQEQREELQRQITEVQERSSPNSESKHWKNLYEKLFAKVQPFQEQLNAFAAHRDALLNENDANQEELNKLADAYAHLLGHQNQKQKIKHVIKLKDQNIALKQEVSKLRSQVSRQKCDLEQLKSKLPSASRRRFDPSKAFQHDKENMQSETGEVLKEGNHRF